MEDRFAQAGYPENGIFYLEGRFTHRANLEYIPEEDLSSIHSPMDLETAFKTAHRPDAVWLSAKLSDRDESSKNVVSPCFLCSRARYDRQFAGKS
ncbi:hypothetical protein [Allobaculum sp. Allo2]|uniref:hypothetical protein n=1 Tax=Allobaculum sp. Allo2 TaxID=2853432 RepID=UPI001F612DEF|nr:hypothetical protein [Allobaculum sp. Allo2]UNT92391.1 hypothetical protein KWG61_09395 [Allobaculum sp. Allo2]